MKADLEFRRGRGHSHAAAAAAGSLSFDVEKLARQHTR